VTVNDSWGDVAVDAHGVNVTNGSVEPLRVVVHASVSSGPAPLRVSFVANASGGTGAPFAFLWQLGDGNVSSGAGVSHTYERVGTYLVNVTARDSGGAVDANGFVIVVSAPVSASGGPPGSSSLAELALLSGLLVGALLAVVTRRRSGSPRRSTSP
jgi:PKD repeat protein